VLDVGCGCGQTTLELAERVGDAGQVVGADISGPMLAEAQRKLDASGRTNVELIQADAQTHAFDAGSFDLAFSRFGVMFFADPEAAFSNLLTALRPGGRLVMVCWQEMSRNPWMLVPAAAAAKHVELPAPADPDGPGPFAFRDRERVTEILSRAGFDRIEAESLDRKLVMAGGPNLEQAAGFIMQMGPAGAALREAPADVVEAAAASVQEALRPHMTERGIEMDASAWIYSARRAD
jgi:SAM-dependent methyltransferase